jgi:hypothetical protein
MAEAIMDVNAGAVPDRGAPTGRALPVREVLGGVRGFWTDGRRIERVCYLVGAMLILAGLFHLGVFFVRGGPWYGPVSWRKPTTFGLSFGLTLITIAWVGSFLRARAWLLAVFAVACVLEVVLISVQAWRHVPSHFNNEGPLNTAIAFSLAGGGAVLIVVLAGLTVLAFRPAPERDPAMRLALRAGFVALMGALASGAAMIAKGMVLVKTGHQQAAYTAADALKPVHAVTMHAVLVLPALAWLLTYLPTTADGRRTVIARVTWAYALATAVVILVSLIKFG